MPGQSILDAVSADTAELLVASGTRRTISRSSWLIHEGDPPRAVHLVTDGLLKVVRSSMSGHTTVLALRGAGTLVGEQSLLDDQPASAGAVALMATTLVTVPAERFMDLLDEHPDLSRALLIQLSRRLREASTALVEMAGADALSRVSSRLLDLAGDVVASHDQGDDAVVDLLLPISQQELADWSGLSREAVVKALRQLREDGVIVTGRRRVVINDIDSLERTAALGVG